MPTDLPDYTSYITITTEIPEEETGPVNVGMYKATLVDLEDLERTPLITDIKGRLLVYVAQPTPGTLQAEVIARPKGGILEKNSVTTTDTYATVATRTVTDGKTFQLAKVLVSCPEDVMFKIRWDGDDIGAEVYVTGGIPFTDWFPWDYYEMAGDGAKAVDIQVKYPTDGAAATCHAELVGEEV